MLDEKTFNRIDYLKSQIISDVKNLDFEKGLEMRLRLALSNEIDRLVAIEIDRADPPPPPPPPPPPNPTDSRIVPAPAAVPISIAYGTINLAADGNITWTNASGSQVSGNLAEIFAIDGKVWGRTTGNNLYTSADSSPGWSPASDLTAYKNAYSRATKIIQTANCPPLP